MSTWLGTIPLNTYCVWNTPFTLKWLNTLKASTKSWICDLSVNFKLLVTRGSKLKVPGKFKLSRLWLGARSVRLLPSLFRSLLTRPVYGCPVCAVKMPLSSQPFSSHFAAGDCALK